MEPKRTRHEAARIGARARWGDHQPRTVRLDALSPEARKLVLLLIEAAKASQTDKVAA